MSDRLFYAPLCRSQRPHAAFDHHAALKRECACPCHGGTAPWWSDHKAANAQTGGPMSASTPASASLTRQMVLDAMEKVRNAPYTPCVGSDQHVVHPKEAERGGLATCANCFRVVDLGPGNATSKQHVGVTVGRQRCIRCWSLRWRVEWVGTYFGGGGWVCRSCRKEAS